MLQVDNSPRGGRPSDNLLDDEFYRDILRRATDGEFLAIIAAPPCSTYSVSRFFPCVDCPDGGPPPVRDRHHVDGLEDVPAKHRRELKRANRLTRRTAYILGAAAGAGTEFLLENPADHGDESDPSMFIDARHAPIWVVPIVIELQKLTSTQHLHS